MRRGWWYHFLDLFSMNLFYLHLLGRRGVLLMHVISSSLNTFLDWFESLWILYWRRCFVILISLWLSRHSFIISGLVYSESWLRFWLSAGLHFALLVDIHRGRRPHTVSFGRGLTNMRASYITRLDSYITWWSDGAGQLRLGGLHSRSCLFFTI